MHTIKITPNLLSEYRRTSAKFTRSPNRIETFLCPNWNALVTAGGARCASPMGRRDCFDRLQQIVATIDSSAPAIIARSPCQSKHHSRRGLHHPAAYTRRTQRRQFLTFRHRSHFAGRPDASDTQRRCRLFRSHYRTAIFSQIFTAHAHKRLFTNCRCKL